jgi:hypothetical protein
MRRSAPRGGSVRRVLAGQMVRKELQGDVPTQTHVLGAVDNAHAAAAELFENPIMPECAALHVARRGYCVGDSEGKSGENVMDSTNSRCA